VSGACSTSLPLRPAVRPKQQAAAAHTCDVGVMTYLQDIHSNLQQKHVHLKVESNYVK
jgi:hypothetical protein